MAQTVETAELIGVVLLAVSLLYIINYAAILRGRPNVVNLSLTIKHDTDGNGPNSSHQSVVRDIEICPSASFVNVKRAQAVSAGAEGVIKWAVRGQMVRIEAAGRSALTVDIRDLQGRLVARLTGDRVVQCKLPQHCGILVATVKAGTTRSRFMISADGR